MKREAGFTLLEILMVLTLLGVLLSLIAGAILGANRAVAKAQRFGTGLDEVRASQNFLRVAISQALPLAGQQDLSTVFIGRSDTMTFFGPLPVSLGGGLHQQRIALVDHRLQVDFARITDKGEQSFGDPQVLLHQVKSLQLGYRGTDAHGKLTGWLPDWPWASRLPHAVRINATLDGEAEWVLQQVDIRLDLSSDTVAP